MVVVVGKKTTATVRTMLTTTRLHPTSLHCFLLCSTLRYYSDFKTGEALSSEELVRR